MKFIAIFLLLNTHCLFAQNGNGIVQGKVTDSKSKKEQAFVSLTFLQGDSIKYRVECDIDGFYKLKSAKPGFYNIILRNGEYYEVKEIKGFLAKKNIVNFLDVELIPLTEKIKKMRKEVKKQNKEYWKRKKDEEKYKK